MDTRENIIFKVKAGQKADILGLWKDENGKIYIDHIKAVKVNSPAEFEAELFTMFSQGEKCIFTIGGDKAFIIYPEGESITLNNRYQIAVNRLSFDQIKDLLNDNGGLTIYREEEGYLLEYWKE